MIIQNVAAAVGLKDIYRQMDAVDRKEIASWLKADGIVKKTPRTVDGMIAQMGPSMCVDMAQKLELMGYGQQANTVDDWYEGASEGSRAHMANKLAKHGYPQTGRWSEQERNKRALEDVDVADLLAELGKRKFVTIK